MHVLVVCVVVCLLAVLPSLREVKSVCAGVDAGCGSNTYHTPVSHHSFQPPPPTPPRLPAPSPEQELDGDLVTPEERHRALATAFGGHSHISAPAIQVGG